MRSYFDFKEENLEKFNEKTKAWLQDALPLMEDYHYLRASGGMLMGMHNALSTTYGLLHVKYDKPEDSNFTTLRSSDDSMTLYFANNPNALRNIIAHEDVCLMEMGINLSKKKTQIFEPKYGEYTSWYIDGTMVVQYGPLSTLLRPGGTNSHDDFNAISMAIHTAQRKFEMNCIGAEVALRLGVNNVRYLYRVKRRTDMENMISYNIRLLADGGPNPWDSMTCGLEETCLKECNPMSQMDKDYLAKVRNPDNPFSVPRSEDVTWSKEHGSTMIAMVDAPRTIFSVTKKANRSSTNKKDKVDKPPEKIHSEVLHLVNMSDLSTHISVPRDSGPLSDRVYAALYALRSESNLTLQQESIFYHAMERLISDQIAGPTIDDDVELNLIDED